MTKEKEVIEEKIPARLQRVVPAETEDEEITPKGTAPVLEEEDYLQKYQYVRELPLGDPSTNPRGGKAEIMKKALLKQSKVSILIPVDSGADASVPLSVTLNGYRLDLPRNTYIEVPKHIAEVVMQSQKQTVQALNQFRTDRSKSVEEAL